MNDFRSLRLEDRAYTLARKYKEEVEMNSQQWKFLTQALIIAGSAGVLYGMLQDNDVVFLAGLPCLILGYLIIRKKLKKKGR